MVGVYGIVERAELEPNAQQAERIRVYGAFAFVNGGLNGAIEVGEAKKGYLYFSMPAGVDRTAIAREWNDIKAVAGTQQAIGFGNWFYFGTFVSLKIDAPSNSERFIAYRGNTTVGNSDLRVRPTTEKVANPTVYSTNVGVVKLSETGGHAATVQKLRAALRG
jgi:hypothetical protein